MKGKVKTHTIIELNTVIKNMGYRSVMIIFLVSDVLSPFTALRLVLSGGLFCAVSYLLHHVVGLVLHLTNDVRWLNDNHLINIDIENN